MALVEDDSLTHPYAPSRPLCYPEHTLAKEDACTSLALRATLTMGSRRW